MSVTIDGTSGVTTPALTAGGTPFPVEGGFSMRNRIINGDMRIWQRGTSFSVVATAAYSADRWQIYQPSGTGTITQETDVPSGFKYSLKAVGAGTDVLQRIESANISDLAGESVTISFWLKQTVGAGTGSITVQTQYPTASDNWTGVTDISSQTITPTSSWVRYSLTFTSLPSGVANGYAINIFPTSGGSSSTFYITGVQLEAGSVATPFERRPYGQELALCQRYFYKFGGGLAVCSGAVLASSNLRGFVQLPVEMRATPTGTHTLTGAGTGTTQAAMFINGYPTITSFAFSVDLLTTRSMSFNMTTASGYSSGAAGSWDFGSGAFVFASAEL